MRNTPQSNPVQGVGAPKITLGMVDAGVAVLEEFGDSFSPSALVERVYIAMRDLEASESDF
jgi:hypothetical protein